MIHSSAVVDPAAEIDEAVEIGPYCQIGPGVRIAAGTRIEAHVVIRGETHIGRDNHIFQFNSLGEDPQDKKYQGEVSSLEIGDHNVIREFCTFNRGTAGGGGVTRIGDHNWIMAYVHIAHDCRVGNQNILANGTTLAGHVEVADQVSFGAFTVIHQFCSIGAHSFSAMGTVILKDVPPFLMASGNPAKPRGLNFEGLRRRGFSPLVLANLKQAYRTVYRQGLSLQQAISVLQSQGCEEVTQMADFLCASSRGIVR